jgi:hypothetical protein
MNELSHGEVGILILLGMLYLGNISLLYYVYVLKQRIKRLSNIIATLRTTMGK